MGSKYSFLNDFAWGAEGKHHSKRPGLPCLMVNVRNFESFAEIFHRPPILPRTHILSFALNRIAHSSLPHYNEGRKEERPMHDPMTVAFQIRNPWRTYKPWPKDIKKWEDVPEAKQEGRSKYWQEGYRESCVTIWHVDPETDGTDDSCGFSHAKFTERQRQVLKSLAWSEARNPWLRAAKSKVLEDAVLAENLARAGLLATADALDIKISYDEASILAVRLVHNPIDNIRGSLCLLPGYHTNSQQDDQYWREECAYSLFYCFARNLQRGRRHWWNHPRWHIHHWKIQIHALQNLKRWLFSKCTGCGNRFRWGFAPSCTEWDSDGPRWFKSETNVYCDKCHPSAACLESKEMECENK